MPQDKIIQDIISSTEKAIEEFQKAVPGIQKGLLKEITTALKDLELKDGKILNRVKNLELVMKLRNKVERLIVSEGYKDSVKNFLQGFNQIELLQTEYFKQFNKKFTPSKTLPIVKEAAVDRTLNDLLNQGLEVNVIDRIGKILNDNVTTGGSYADLTEELRSAIINDADGEGILQRYTRTITTDAINQYSAQYHDILAQDLEFNWGRYIGSNLTTTREFCDFLTKKEWAHRSELPTIIKGDIDGHQCKLNKQGLPLGMIPGTTVENFKIRRGGYNCGHQFFWVPDSSVPADIKSRIANPEKKVVNEPIVEPKKVTEPQPSGTKVSSHFTNISPTIKRPVKAVMNAIDEVHGDGVLKDIPIKPNRDKKTNGYFLADGKRGEPIEIAVRTNGPSPELTYAHEMGHYLDFYALGEKGKFASQNTVAGQALIKTINESDAVKAIRENISLGRVIVNGEEHPASFGYIRYMEYLTDPKELMARSYAQFIAKRSSNENMKKQLQNKLDSDKPNNTKHQWDDKDFEQIDRAMEALFIEKGWIKIN